MNTTIEVGMAPITEEEVVVHFGEQGLSDSLVSVLRNRIRRQVESAIGRSFLRCEVQLYGGKVAGPGLPTKPLNARDAHKSGWVEFSGVKVTIDTERDHSGVSSLIYRAPLTTRRVLGEAVWGNEQHLQEKPLKTKRRFVIKDSFLTMPSDFLPWTKEQVGACVCPVEWLFPEGRSTASVREYVVWFCPICGKRYLCACAEGLKEYYKNLVSPERGDGQLNILHQPLFEAELRADICHLCRDVPPTRQAYDPMYGGSRIKLYYLPYINQLGIQSGLDMLNKEHKREAENLLRDRIGVPRVGEGWVSETELYRTIRAIFPGRRIEREASPDFLGKQRFDIYFPDEGVAVEYQGEQHAGPVGRFGGRSGHERAVERDQSKREKAEKAGVQLVEFWYYEKITEEKVRKRLGKFLGDE